MPDSLAKGDSTRCQAATSEVGTATASETPPITTQIPLDRSRSDQIWRLAITTACTILLAFLTVPAAAQPSRLRFDNLGIEDGLPNSYVYAIEQDHTGYLWMGTANGLARYDGYGFEVYLHDPEDPDSLCHNLVRRVLADRQGSLWIGTIRGLDRYDRNSDRFEHIVLDSANPDSADARIGTLYLDRDKRLWVGSSIGLTRIDREGQITFHPSADVLDADQPPLILAMLEDHAGILWLGTNQGLLRFDRQAESFSPLPTAADGSVPLSGRMITSLLEDEHHALWIATANSGVSVLDPNRTNVRHYGVARGDEPGVLSNEIFVLFEDSRGNLWVGGRQNGLSRFDRESGSFLHHRHDASLPNSLINDTVWSIAEDRFGILWVGTEGGVGKLDPARMQFVLYQEEAANPKSLSNNWVSSFVEDRSGGIWIGTEGGGLNRLDLATETLRHYRHDPDDSGTLSSDIVLDLDVDTGGRLWIATPNGLDSLDPSTDSIRRFRPPQAANATGLQVVRVRALAVDHHGLIHVGTWKDGFFTFDPQTETFKRYKNYPLELEEKDDRNIHNILDILVGQESLVWIAARGTGLIRFDPKSERFTLFEHEPDTLGSLSSNSINGIDQGVDGILWVGTREGLNRFDPATERFEYIQNPNGLSSNFVKSLAVDDQGGVWLGTGNGLSLYDPDKGTFKSFYRSDGLQSDQFYAASSYRSRSGELFFGGINGFNRFRPGSIHTDQIPPTVVFTDAFLYNRRIPITAGPGDGHLQQHINETTHMTFTHRDSVIAFQFAALHFRDPSRNQYRYILDGFHQDWLETESNNRFATFTNLDAGNYTLRVQAANKDGVWSESGKALAITVLPPPWKTWWAYTLYVLAISSGIIAYVISHRRKLAHERSVNERLRAVDRLKDEFLANTSHELRTPLNGIIGLTESLLEGAAGNLNRRLRTDLEMVSSSGRRLANLVNDILDFSRLRGQKLELSCQPVDLRQTIEAVLSLSEPLIGERKICLFHTVANDLPPVLADESRLYQILHNLIGNAIKFTEQGEVQVDARADEHGLTFTVSDTGIGIPEEKLDRIFKSFEQVDGSAVRQHSGTGLGLAVTKQLVTLHRGSIHVTSKLGQGTKFSVTLPSAEGVARRPPAAAVLARQRQFFAKGGTPNTDEPIADMSVEASRGAYRLLIVDDDLVNRRVIASYLSPIANYELVEAADGDAALRAVAEDGPFDLILLDVMMPKMSGYEVCERLRQDHSKLELPIIFVTAKNQVADLVTGFSKGCNDYLAKPVSRSELLSRIKAQLDLLRSNQELELQVVEKSEAVEARNLELDLIEQLTRISAEKRDLATVAQTLLKQGLALVAPAQKARLLMCDADRDHFRFKTCLGYRLEDINGQVYSPHQALARFTDRSQQIGDGISVVHPFRLAGSARSRNVPVSMLSIAIESGGQIVAFMLLDNYEEPEAFETIDLPVLERLRERTTRTLAQAFNSEGGANTTSMR